MVRARAFARIDDGQERPERRRLTKGDAIRLGAAHCTLADFANLWRRPADQEPSVFLPVPRKADDERNG